MQPLLPCSSQDKPIGPLATPRRSARPRLTATDPFLHISAGYMFILARGLLTTIFNQVMLTNHNTWQEQKSPFRVCPYSLRCFKPVNFTPAVLRMKRRLRLLHFTKSARWADLSLFLIIIWIPFWLCSKQTFLAAILFLISELKANSFFGEMFHSAWTNLRRNHLPVIRHQTTARHWSLCVKRTLVACSILIGFEAYFFPVASLMAFFIHNAMFSFVTVKINKFSIVPCLVPTWIGNDCVCKH